MVAQTPGGAALAHSVGGFRVILRLNATLHRQFCLIPSVRRWRIPERGFDVKWFSCCFFPPLLYQGAYALRRSPRLRFERFYHDRITELLTRQGESAEIRRRSLMVSSASPVAVGLVLATAPQHIPSCIRWPYGQRSGSSISDRLARYCSLRPSCEAKLVPITVTSLGGCPPADLCATSD